MLLQRQAAAYILAGAATFLIRNEPRPGHVPARLQPIERASVLDSIGEGFRYSLRRHRTVLLLLLVGMIPSLLVYPYLRFVQVFAINIFHVGGLGYGILFTGVGVGSLAGAAWIARHSAFERQGLEMLWGNVVYMCGIAAFAIVRQVEIAFAFLIIAGVANTLYNTLNQTLLQFNIEDEYRGRVLALYLTLNSVTPNRRPRDGSDDRSLGRPVAIVFAWCLFCRARHAADPRPLAEAAGAARTPRSSRRRVRYPLLCRRSGAWRRSGRQERWRQQRRAAGPALRRRGGGRGQCSAVCGARRR